MAMSLIDAIAKLFARVSSHVGSIEDQAIVLSEDMSETLTLVDALTFLHHNRVISDRVLFRPRDSDSLTIGLGVYRASESLEPLLPLAVDSLCVLGAGSFEGGVDQKGHWLVPKLIVDLSPSQSRVSVIFDASERESVMRFLHSVDVNFARRPVIRPLKVLTERLSISEATFSSLVDDALAAIASESLEKVVLSVSKTLRISEDIDPCLFLLALVESINLHERYVLFVSTATKSLLSLSPERLFRISADGHLETEALAGTFAHDETGETDKLIREHGHVTSYVADRLQELSEDSVQVLSREVVRLGNSINHWRVKLSTQLPASGASEILQVARSLHPTPAVCGFPLSQAKAFITAREGVRDHYAAPCGIVRQGEADFLVGIRSAEINHRNAEITVRSGAGIVRGSVADAEWQEIMKKMSSVTNIFDHSEVGLHLSNMTVFSCFLLLEELRRQGVTEVVMSPGSRSSPLVIAAEHLKFKIHIFIDERSSGFFALGRAKAGHVVPVIVTSGTAVANLAPAFAEASTSGIGLLVISSDREAFQTGTGENQALVHQDRLFSGMSDVMSRCLSLPVRTAEQAASLLSDADFAHFNVTSGRVFHFNFGIPYSDLTPLSTDGSKRKEVAEFTRSRVMKRWIASTGPFTRHLTTFAEFESGDMSRTLFVAGDLQSERVPAELMEALCESAVVISDSLSGIPSRWPLLVNSAVLRGAVADHVRRIVWLGGNLISKQVQNWLASLGASVPVIRVSANLARIDPQFITSVYFHVTVTDFVSSLLAQGSFTSLKLGHQVMVAQTACDEALAFALGNTDPDISLAEPLVCSVLSDLWKHKIFLGAGMACRDFNSFSSPGISRRVFMNRGANGIDGLIASAMGASEGEPLVLLLGDCSCLYDVSSLPSLKNFPFVKVVVLNNDGGGIFRFLRDERNSLISAGAFKCLWETSHGLQLADVAASLGISAVCVETVGELRVALNDSDVQLIECRVPGSEVNVKLHHDIGRRVASAVDAAVLGDEGINFKWMKREQAPGALVILLHGWLGSSDDWNDVTKHFRFNADVVAIQIRSESDTPSLLAHRLNKLIDQLSRRESPVILVGYSMGGRLAMHYASLFPVAGVVLLSTCPGVQPSLNRPAISEKLATCSEAEFLSYWYSEIPIFANLASRDSSVLDRRFDRMIAVSHLENFSHTVCSPDAKILGILVGSLDAKYVSLSAQTGLKTFVVDGAGHALLLERSCIKTTVAHVEKLVLSAGVCRDAVAEEGHYRLLDFSIEEYEIPLETSDAMLVRSATVRLLRRGFLVRTTGVLETDQSKLVVRGIGEVPEPIRSGRSLGDLKVAVGALLESLVGSKLYFCADRVELVAGMRSRTEDKGLAFVLEQVMLTSVADSFSDFPLAAVVQKYVESLSDFEISGMPMAVKLNSLEQFRGDEVPVKLKVGGDPLTDAQRVNAYCEQHPNVQLRLDANQLWTSDEALHFARALSRAAVAAVEYIEEPVCQPKRGKLRVMSRNPMWRGIRIALDESIQGKEELWRELSEDPEFALVLKPFVFNIQDTVSMLLSGHVTISTTFETGVGLCFLVCLVAAVGGSGFHGLFPHPAMRDRYTCAFSEILRSGQANVLEAEQLLRRFL